MTFLWVGAQSPRWLDTHQGVPWMVSATRLATYRPSDEEDMPRAHGPWVLDSGGFSELQRHGRWRWTEDEYGGLIVRFLVQCGAPPLWVAPQDRMCEPLVISGGTDPVTGQHFAGTGLDVRTHQDWTVENFVYLRREYPFINWLPILQGWTLRDYLRCVTLYRRAGIDLTRWPLVGVGSICRRQNSREAQAIIEAIHARGLTRLHGFGVKVTGLRRYGPLITSADSMAWSAGAKKRRIRMPDGACPHPGDCRNCPRWAIAWRRQILTALPVSAQPALDVFDAAS